MICLRIGLVLAQKPNCLRSQQSLLKPGVQFLLQTPFVEAQGRVTPYHTEDQAQISFRLCLTEKKKSTCLSEGKSF